jgi:MHS family proline/betaine transporter-like MFS transporter
MLGNSLAAAYLPDPDPARRLLELYVVYAAGSLLRPLGALAAPRLAGRSGSRRAMLWALAVSCLATAFIGAIPRYSQVRVRVATLVGF